MRVFNWSLSGPDHAGRLALSLNAADNDQYLAIRYFEADFAARVLNDLFAEADDCLETRWGEKFFATK